MDWARALYRGTEMDRARALNRGMIQSNVIGTTECRVQ